MTALRTTRSMDPKDLELEHANWQNPRTISGLDKPSIKAFAAEVKLRGVFVPLIVQRVTNGDGKIHTLVLDGQRRKLGAIEAGLEEVPVVDHWPEPVELTEEVANKLMLEVLAAGAHREGLSSYEQSEVAVKLRKQGTTHAEIAKAIGRDSSWVSRFLRARSDASLELMASWMAGKVTDEQFKDLASVPTPKQAEALSEVVETREKGHAGKAEARARSKEIKASAAPAKKYKTTTVKGRQLKLPIKGLGKAAKIEATKAKPTSRVMLEEILAMAAKKAPLADYVKGLMDGVRHALGLMDPKDFAHPWKVYLSRLPGGGKASKKAAQLAKKKTKTVKKPVTNKAIKAKGTSKRKEMTKEQRAAKNAGDRARRAKKA